MDEKNVTRQLAEPTSVTSTTPGLQREEWLEGIAVGVRGNELVMQELFPETGVRFDSAKFRVYSPKGLFKGAPKRAEGSLPQQAAIQWSDDNYVCEEYALEGWVTDESRRNAANDIDPFIEETEFLTAKVLLSGELLAVAELLSAIKTAGSTYYTTLTSATRWDSGADKDILGDISTVIKAIVKRVGRRPNITTMNTDTYEAIVNDEDVRDILKMLSSGTVTEAMPINAIRGMRILLADAVVSTSAPDAANPTYQNVLYDVDTTTTLNQTVVISYIKPGDKLTLGRTMVSSPFQVYRGRDLEGSRRKSDLVMVSKKFVPKVTNVGAAHVIGKVLG